MFLKSKHANVIIYSSLVIAIVLVSTLAGYTLYIQWKEDSFALTYRNSIYKLTAEMFRQDVILSNVNVKIWEGAPYGEMPVFEGKIKNNSAKAVASLTIEVAFRRPDGSVAYKAWMNPLGDKESSPYPISAGVGHARNVLLPGEGMSFAQILRNCPREVTASLPRKSKLAKDVAKKDLVLEYAIVGVSVL